MSLYQSGYQPIGVKRAWERTSMICAGQGQAGAVLRKYGVPEAFGDPSEAVGWWDDDGTLRALLADYQNGRRADLRIRMRGSSLSLTSPSRDTPA